MPAERDASTGDAAALRRRAEARLRAEKPTVSSGDPQRLMHELQVHQIQLEMQNEELREARGQLESLVEKYTDLYDFAPVGYFSLDGEARIREVNLTGAAMLGVERSQLISRRFSSFVTATSRPAFAAFLKGICGGNDKKVCEVALETRADHTIWADLQGSRNLHPVNETTLCRIAVSDITALKRAAEAQSRAEALQALNQNLQVEVTRRKLTEQSLRESKRRQSVLLSESQTLQEQLRMLSHRVLHAQEVERKSISRDLHDEIAQTLAAINVHLASLASDPAADTGKMQKKIALTQALVAQSVESVHRFAMGLRPTMLDDLGLVPALRACSCDFSEETKLPVHLDLPPDFKPLPDSLAVAFYRVARAALSNIALHAKATKVGLTLSQKQGSLILTVSDNGKSFDVKAARTGEKINASALLACESAPKWSVPALTSARRLGKAPQLPCVSP